MGVLVKYKEYVWTHGKAFQIHQSFVYAVKVLGACELYLSFLNSWVSWWSTRNMSELMGEHFESIRVLFTLWRCWVHVSYTLACWTHGCLGEVRGVLLKSWESILNPSEFCLRCEDVACMWTRRHPAELMGGLAKYRAHGWTLGKHVKSIRILFALWRCWVHVNSLAAWWRKRNMAELTGNQFKSIRILFMLWRCWVHETTL